MKHTLFCYYVIILWPTRHEHARVNPLLQPPRADFVGLRPPTVEVTTYKTRTADVSVVILLLIRMYTRTSINRRFPMCFASCWREI